MNKPTLSRTNSVCNDEYDYQFSKPTMKRTITLCNNMDPIEDESTSIMNNVPYLQYAMLHQNNEPDINYDDDRFVECDECNIHVDCYKHSIHVAYKGQFGNPTEELTMCTMCFQDMEEELIKNGYLCDDWEEEEEDVKVKANEENVDKEAEAETIKLCENMDCERYPPDWDFEEDTEETYQEDQWKKCCLCDGYFNDNGMGDILFVQEEPNNQEAGCSLCGKSDDVVQMKGCGQYLCGNGCDEDEDEEED